MNTTSRPARRFRTRLERVVVEEFGSIHPVTFTGSSIARLLPPYSAYRARGSVLRATGWRIDRTALLADVPSLSGPGDVRERLTIGPNCFVNVRCHFELCDVITIGSGVAIGHEVLVLTSSHRIGAADQRAGELVTASVSIGSGAWIGARAIIHPGVTVGAGSIVASGAVVTRDVAADTLVAGIPARLVRAL